MHSIVEYKDLTWVDVVKPTEVDSSFLKTKFNLHPVTFRNIVPPIMHPTFDAFEDYLAMTLHYPRNEEGQDVEIYEIDIIVGKNFLITNHYTPLRPISSILDRCQASETDKKECLENGNAYFLLLILNKFLKRLLEKTDKIGESVRLIEKEIFTNEEEKMIKRISYLKRQIISFWRAIEPQGEIFSSLKKAGPDFFGQEHKHDFSDLFDIYQRIDNSLKTYKETVESLEETSHNIINIKRTEIIKILTVVSLILMPPTLVASIWGMNVPLPFSKSTTDFWILCSFMVVIPVVMIIYFRLKKWL
jgi:magnesium transporter